MRSQPDSTAINVFRTLPNRAKTLNALRNGVGETSSAARGNSCDLHVFKLAGLVVDADFRRRDPRGEFAGL
jgi:hypothetical protein